MKTPLVLIALGFSLAVGLPMISSAEVDPAEATMNVMRHNAFQPRLQRVIAEGSREIIVNYMLEHHVIVQEQLDEWEAMRATAHEELQELREAGDFDAMKTRMAELRAEMAQQRAVFRDYVSQNDELRLQLAEFRQGVRQEFRERIRVHVEQVHNQAGEPISE